MRIPQSLVDGLVGEGRESWLEGLPDTLRELAARWGLLLGEAFEPGGTTSWVAPAHAQGREVVLKVMCRHPEAEHEAEGLREWAGDGAVHLYADMAFDDTRALLLEPCTPGTALAGRPADEQDAVIAALLRRLWRPPTSGHPFRPLQAMCDQWLEAFARKIANGRAQVDGGLARDGIGLFRELPATAGRQVLLATDLHAGNVLSAERQPWLVIDPKPHVGDPTYDVLQHLLNCESRLLTDPRTLCRRMADLLGVDQDRLTAWLFARCVLESPDRPELADVARRLSTT